MLAGAWDVCLGALPLLRVAGSSGKPAQVCSLGGSEFQALKHKVFSSFCLHQDMCISSASPKWKDGETGPALDGVSMLAVHTG